MPPPKDLTEIHQAARKMLAQPIHTRDALCHCGDGYCTACRLRDLIEKAESEGSDA